MTELSRQVLALIEIRGSDRPLPVAEIARALRIVASTAEQIISELRIEGYPICESDKGCYWPKHQYELEAYLAAARERMELQRKECEGMEKGGHLLKQGEPLPSEGAKIEIWLFRGRAFEVRASDADWFQKEHFGAYRA